MHAASIMQACFCGATLQEKQQKPQYVWQHLCGADRSELLEGPDRSTSELTVSDCVGDRLGKVYGGMRHHHGYKRGMADASTSRVRARQVFLRLPSASKIPPLYELNMGASAGGLV